MATQPRTTTEQNEFRIKYLQLPNMDPDGKAAERDNLELAARLDLRDERERIRRIEVILSRYEGLTIWALVGTIRDIINEAHPADLNLETKNDAR